MREKVQKVIDRLKPAFAGNDVTLLSVKDGVVKVRVFAPGCSGGPPKEATVALLKEELMDQVPEVKELVVD
jgi:hypothetical protein